MSRNVDVFLPVDGSVATHCSSSGVIPSTVNAPTMKYVKSAALAKRSR